MNAYRIIISLLVAYSAFYLLRALLTGEAQVFRKRNPSTRKDSPKEYWGFVTLMGICAAGGLFLILAR
jgi:hypothetical protein